MTKEQLKEILDKHQLWLNNAKDGKFADLSDADLANANLRGANLRYTNTQGIIGQKVIAVQVDTSRHNNMISYWVDLDVVTTSCFQGTMNELKEQVEIIHKDNQKLLERYRRVIAFIENEI